MGSRKARDYDQIIKELSNIEKEMSNLCSDGSKLQSEGSAAEATLRDRVAKKNIDAVVELGAAIRKLASDGEARIRELRQSIEKDKAEFEELDR